MVPQAQTLQHWRRARPSPNHRMQRRETTLIYPRLPPSRDKRPRDTSHRDASSRRKDSPYMSPPSVRFSTIFSSMSFTCMSLRHTICNLRIALIPLPIMGHTRPTCQKCEAQTEGPGLGGGRSRALCIAPWNQKHSSILGMS